MKEYQVEVWFRKGDEKDFEIVTVIAKNESDAENKAKEFFSYPFKTTILC